MALTRSQIKAKKTLAIRTIKVPEWADESGNNEVCIRILKAAERDGFEFWRGQMLEKHKAGEPIAVKAKLVILACCDERGEPLFDEDDLGDLGEGSGVAIDRVYDAILCHNGMDRESQEEIRKNSKAPLASAGSTAKPAS